MVADSSQKRQFRMAIAAVAIALLTACGGGGGSNRGGIISTPPSLPPPPPPPPPPPTTIPAAQFDTAEVRRSNGANFHNAVSAWTGGINGTGKTIAIVDTGIDEDSPEFAGRLHPNSASVSGTGTVQQEDDHGTNVALVAAAARDDAGVIGIAYNATVLAIRADTPGSCATEDPADATLGCTFNDRNIAAGIDLAINSGATVVNLSLGGSRPSAILRNAVTRAAQAGLVIIVSAGNDGASTEDDVDPDQPDPFAAGLLEAGGPNVIIVGSVDDQGVISQFSNRAGSLASSYLNARGERICCVYEDGSLFITEENGQRFVTLFSGTSFSAPQVSGAAALLAQAFPNLTGAQIVEILLDSARDAGAAGTDAIYGRGILDIARALAPAGTTRLAGNDTVLALTDDAAIGSGAMGDALRGQSLGTVITDKYRRAYNLDLGTRLCGAAVSQRLHAALDTDLGRRVSVGGGSVAMAFSLGTESGRDNLGRLPQLRLTREDAGQARILAARVALRIDAATQIGFTLGESADGLVAQMQGQSRPAFLIANDAGGDTGFTRGTDFSAAFRKQIGAWGVTGSVETGDAWLGNLRQVQSHVGDKRERRDLASFAIGADRRFGDLSTVAGIGWMRESETVLGAFFHESFGANGADSLFLDLGASYDIDSHWTLGGQFRRGMTRADTGGLVSNGSRFNSTAWSMDVTRGEIFSRHDLIGLRISQPLRVSGGGLNLNLPVGYDYTIEAPIYGLRQLSLAPDGREIVGELSWQGPLWSGYATAAMFYRQQPGHYAAQPADAGVALKWRSEF